MLVYVCLNKEGYRAPGDQRQAKNTTLFLTILVKIRANEYCVWKWVFLCSDPKPSGHKAFDSGPKKESITI